VIRPRRLLKSDTTAVRTRWPVRWSVLGTDTVYNDAHPWTAESDAARRNKWCACLRKLESWEPLVVIPGHCSPEKLHADNIEGIAFTLEYLDVYDEVLAEARTGDELVLGMERRYPGMKAIDYGVHWQARILFLDGCSDWIQPLPGFFLAPNGEFLGETAKTT
jgi:hypothetical protein